MVYKKIYLGIEFIVLFFGVPLFLLFYRNLMLPSTVLLPVLVLIFFLLHKNPRFKWKELFYWNINKSLYIKHAKLIILAILVLVGFVLVFIPGELFNLPKNNWKIWIAICFFYPVFSVFAQEIIFRTFIFKRYVLLFNKPIYFILASGISFSFAHIFYYSHISILTTFILGIYLASVYLKTKSVLFTSLIHGILGDVVFTIGMGQYFWLEMYKWL